MSKKSLIETLKAREEARTLTLNSSQIETLRVLFRTVKLLELEDEFVKNYGKEAAQDYVKRLLNLSKEIFNFGAI